MARPGAGVVEDRSPADQRDGALVGVAAHVGRIRCRSIARVKASRREKP
jgi:hypothetical protein